MKLRSILMMMLISVLLTSTVLSKTTASFTDAVAGADTALIAKWNLGARGEDDIDGEFYNKGFTFNLFDGRSVEPMDCGEKSFTFTSGGSDVAMVYDVKMNAADLMKLTTPDTKATIALESGKDVYCPFIFKITATINNGATDTMPSVFSPYDETSPFYGTGWFRPKDIAFDEEGYFSVFTGTPSFSAGSNDQVTITVFWQWNTSFYICDTGIEAVTAPNSVAADPSTTIVDEYLPYYQTAYDQYYGSGGLQDRYEAAVNETDLYLDIHGSPNSDGTWPPHDIVCALTDDEHNEEYAAIDNPDPAVKEALQREYLAGHGGIVDEIGNTTWTLHTISCTEDHFAQYNARVKAAEYALENCKKSLLAAYNDYDTFAADVLAANEPVKVLFRISGEQIEPEQK